MPSPQRSERFEIKLRPRERALIDRAARASGQWMSEIVRSAAVRRARRLIRENERDEN